MQPQQRQKLGFLGVQLKQEDYEGGHTVGTFNTTAQRIVDMEDSVRDQTSACDKHYPGTRSAAHFSNRLSHIMHATLELCWGQAEVHITHGTNAIDVWVPVG